MSNAAATLVPLIAPAANIADEFDFLALAGDPATPETTGVHPDLLPTFNGPFYTEPAALHRPATYRCEPDMSLACSYRIQRIQRPYHLTEALTYEAKSGPMYCELPSGEIGIINTIQREDGSGRCFNVTMSLWHTNEIVTRFVRFPKSND